MAQTSMIAANPQLPFVGRIPGGFTQGSSLEINGCFNNGSPRLHINIQDTASSENAIPLHLSIRSTENCIVRNHRQRTTWGAEERQGGLPIRPGQHFRLIIAAEATAFTISIDGTRFTGFNYRLGLEKAQFINIHGDAQIFNIIMANHQSVPPIAICPMPPVHVNPPYVPPVVHPIVPIMGPVHHHNPPPPPHHPHHPHRPHHPPHFPPHPHHHHGGGGRGGLLRPLFRK